MQRGFFLLAAALPGFKGRLPKDNNKARIVTPRLPEKPSHDKEAKTDIQSNSIVFIKNQKNIPKARVEKNKRIH